MTRKDVIARSRGDLAPVGAAALRRHLAIGREAASRAIAPLKRGSTAWPEGQSGNRRSMIDRLQVAAPRPPPLPGDGIRNRCWERKAGRPEVGRPLAGLCTSVFLLIQACRPGQPGCPGPGSIQS